MFSTQTAPLALREALQSDEWFAACPPQMRTALLERARLWTLSAGQSLFERGGAPEGLCCVIAGALRIEGADSEGRVTLLAWLEPYQWFGEISMIDALPRTHDAVAAGATQVLVIPRTELLDWLAANPACWRDLAVLACRKLRTAFSAMEDLARLPLEQRLHRRLLLLAQSYGSRPEPRRRIQVGQEALASMLGISRQSVNKALRALEAAGAVRLHYAEIELLALPDADPASEVPGAGRAGPISVRTAADRG